MMKGYVWQGRRIGLIWETETYRMKKRGKGDERKNATKLQNHCRTFAAKNRKQTKKVRI